jgi:hypothetical protein
VISLAHDGGFSIAVVAIEGEAKSSTEAWLTGRAAIDLPEPSAVDALIQKLPGVSAETSTGPDDEAE